MLNRISAQKLQLLALILLVVYPVVILLARTGIWHFRNSFLIMIFTAIVAFVVLILAIFKLSRGVEGEGKPLILSMLATAVPLVILGNYIALGQTRPFIHDITTDFSNPPALVVAAELRGADDHPVTYEGGDVATAQQEGYPNLKPLLLNGTPQEVFAQAKQTIEDMGWELVGSQNETLPYTLEAVHTSTLFGFKDDIAVRISENEAGVRIDMRSKSRVGKSDLGANADRIEAFFEALGQ